MFRIILFVVILFVSIGSLARAGWPDAYLKYRGNPDISKVHYFKNTVLKSNLIEIRSRAGGVLDVVVNEGSIQIAAMVAKSANLKEGEVVARARDQRVWGWLKFDNIYSHQPQLYSLLAQADRLSIPAWRFTFSRFEELGDSPIVNSSFLVVRVKDWSEVKDFIAIYFYAKNEEELMISWYPADKPKNSEWMSFAQVDRLILENGDSSIR